MVNKIKEQIVVAVVFNRTPLIKPVWFLWRGRRYSIDKITYRWIDKEGCETLYHFAVSDGANIYELCYNSMRLTWQLIAVEA